MSHKIGPHMTSRTIPTWCLPPYPRVGYEERYPHPGRVWKVLPNVPDPWVGYGMCYPMVGYIG